MDQLPLDRCLIARAAGFPNQPVDDLIPAIDQDLRGAQQNLAAVLRQRRRPTGLACGRLTIGFVDIFGARRRERDQGVAAVGIEVIDLP